MRKLGRGIGWLTLVGALSMAVYAAYRGEEAAPSLWFDPASLVLPAPLEQGRSYERALMMVNDADEPVTVVGMVEFCGAACFAGRGFPTTIPARGRGPVTIQIETGRGDPGPLVEEMTFYTSSPTQPTIVAKIQGQIVESSTHEPRNPVPTLE